MDLAKVDDGIMFAGTTQRMDEFIAVIKTRFHISKSIVDGPILSKSCRIVQDVVRNIAMKMEHYVNWIAPFDISPDRRKLYANKAP